MIRSTSSRCSHCGGSLKTPGVSGDLEQWWDDGYGGKRCLDCQQDHIQRMLKDRDEGKRPPSVGCLAMLVLLFTALATQVYAWLH